MSHRQLPSQCYLDFRPSTKFWGVGCMSNRKKPTCEKPNEKPCLIGIVSPSAVWIFHWISIQSFTCPMQNVVFVRTLKCMQFTITYNIIQSSKLYGDFRVHAPKCIHSWLRFWLMPNSFRPLWLDKYYRVMESKLHQILYLNLYLRGRDVMSLPEWEDSCLVLTLRDFKIKFLAGSMSGISYPSSIVRLKALIALISTCGKAPPYWQTQISTVTTVNSVCESQVRSIWLSTSNIEILSSKFRFRVNFSTRNWGPKFDLRSWATIQKSVRMQLRETTEHDLPSSWSSIKYDKNISGGIYYGPRRRPSEKFLAAKIIKAEYYMSGGSLLWIATVPWFPFTSLSSSSTDKFYHGTWQRVQQRIAYLVIAFIWWIYILKCSHCYDMKL